MFLFWDVNIRVLLYVLVLRWCFMLNQFWKIVGKGSASSLEPEGQFELQPCLFTLRLARHDVEFRFYLQMGGNICWRTANLMQPWKFSVDHFYKYPLDLSSSYGINLKDLIYVVHYYYYYFSKACIPLFKCIPKQPLLNNHRNKWQIATLDLFF